MYVSLPPLLCLHSVSLCDTLQYRSGRAPAFGEFEVRWESRTEVDNYSGQSVAKLKIWSDWSLVLYEHVYRNAPSIEPLLLWQATNSRERAKGQVVLQLSDDGCVEIMDADGVMWQRCAATSSVSSTTFPTNSLANFTEMSASDSPGSVQQVQTSGDISSWAESVWWLSLVILALVVLFISCM